VSITQRILESAQSQWSKLTSLVIVDEEPLSQVDAAALQAELTARKAAQAAAPRVPTDNPVAKLAGVGAEARAARERAATQRRTKVLRERDERAARQRAAADEAYRKVKEAARSGGGAGPSRSAGGSSGASSSQSGGRPPRPGSTEAQVLEWHKTLDVPLGADLAQIKSAYRQLMRKYHPDMHANNPQKQKAATELSLRVTAAYNGLVERLDKKR
jgi:DnaJ-domain-containing protein 1